MESGKAKQRIRDADVVIVGMHYAPEHSGNAPYTSGIARHLAASGMTVSAIVGYPHYPEWRLHVGYEAERRYEYDAGVHLARQRHPIPESPTPRARITMECIFALKAALALLRVRTPVVVAVSPVLLSLVPAVLLRRLRRFSLGVVVQDLYGAALSETGLGNGRIARLTAWLEVQLLRRADSVVVIHDVFKRRLTAAGVPSQRIRVIHNWSHINVEADIDVEQTREALGWGKDEFIALHAGNMGVKQGLEGLVDTARLAQERGAPVRVVLMGAGSRRAALSQRAARASKLSIVDPLPAGQFEAALQAADCLLLHEKPGVVEMSVPSKLTSYFMAGRPVVAATDPRSGAAALIDASNAGIAVPAGDPAAILGAIERICGDDELANALGSNGREYASHAMTGSTALQDYETWVRELSHATEVPQ